MYIVGFNGPPRTGKDTLADALAAKIEAVHSIPVKFESLSMPLREIAYAMVGYKGLIDGPEYEKFKEMTFDAFGGVTGRQLMIDVSEKFLKQAYGIDIMAYLMVQRNKGFQGLILLRDSGFQIEVDPLVNWVGARSIYIARTHRDGYTFEGDSREYVNHPDSGMQSDFYNNDSLDEWQNTEAGRLYGRLVNQAGWRF